MKQITNNFFIKMFTSNTGVSSKRVSGFIGWLVCLFICIWCTICGIQAPQIIDMLFICSTTLLGVDTIMRPFYNKGKKQNNEGEINKNS